MHVFPFNITATLLQCMDMSVICHRLIMPEMDHLKCYINEVRKKSDSFNQMLVVIAANVLLDKKPALLPVFKNKLLSVQFCSFGHGWENSFEDENTWFPD